MAVKTVNKKTKDVTKTQAFKDWFGDSKVVDKKGKPLVVYHATTQKFFEFDRERGNAEGWFGLGFYFTDSLLDATNNYLSSGADLTNRIERLTDRYSSKLEDEYDDIIDDKKSIAKEYGLTPNQVTALGDFRSLAKHLAKKELKGEYELTLPFYLSLQNPLDLRRNGTYYDAQEVYNEEDDSYEENEDSLTNKLYEAIRVVSYDDYFNEYNNIDFQQVFDDIGSGIDYQWEGTSAYSVDKAFRSSSALLDVGDEYGNSVSYEFIRRVYEEMGFDGIIMDADLEFGSRKKMGKSMIMDEGTTHFIAFEPNQMKLADGTNISFRKDTNDFRYEKGGKMTTFVYEIGGL